MKDDVQTKLALARAARQRGQFADARAQYREVTAEGRKLANSSVLVAGLRGLGQIAKDLGELSESLKYCVEAVDVSRNQRDKLLLARTIRHLADVHRQLGDLDTSEPLYLEALEIYREHPQTGALELANAVRPLALLREQQSSFQEASVLWEEAKRLYESVSIGAGVAECRDAIARCS